MSSPTAGAQGVSVKVNHLGVTRRFKLSLRDINMNTFEDKIREFLRIPPGYPCKIERYSDSAASYVVLDRSNVSVYKQLHRAAKAKAKLKIRVTDIPPTHETQRPQPATVETEEETAQAELQGELAASQESSEDTSEKIEAQTKPEPRSTPQSIPARQSFPLRPPPVVPPPILGFETEAGDVAQSLAGAPEVPKKEPLDSLPADNADVNVFSRFGAPSKGVPVDMLNIGPPPAEGARASAYAGLGFGDFRVCCNSCERTIPDTHYHCGKCDDDDFDLCMSCVQAGITCYGSDHWLIKRFKRNGMFVSSTTEKLPPRSKPKPKEEPLEESLSAQMKAIEDLGKRLRQGIAQDLEAGSGPQEVKPSLFDYKPLNSSYKPLYTVRACNNCVQELPEHNFLHCDTCEDFDLCKECFAKDNHGHHPKHAFAAAVPTSHIADHVSAKLGAGRNTAHKAICDKCDNFIRGIRHKCFDCPDFDYCNDCLPKGLEEHAGHRFAPIYEPLPEPFHPKNLTIHQGICCDGPMCAAPSVVTYITGVRYKCAVCPDTDFCGACEAHPKNTHNKTHPLIKFKTAVRHAAVSTSGFDPQGAEMPLMGDAASKAAPARKPTISSPRAVVSVEPSEPTVEKKTEQAADTRDERQAEEVRQPEYEEKKPAVAAPEKTAPSASDLGAVYVRDTVMDGTVIQPNSVFEQTWILRNSGDVAWPSGCAVKFVGGDYMGHVDSKHPAGISELVSASESTVCYDALEPGREYPFTVLLRTPPREGKITSYWRLTAPDGLRFGHRLWCDVHVQTPKTVSDVAASPSEVSAKKAEPAVGISQMVFPKLEKESPMSSIHQDSGKEAASAKEAAAFAPSHEAEFDELDEWKGETEAWDGSDEGFLTDEEYDILDASDEELPEDPKLKTAKK